MVDQTLKMFSGGQMDLSFQIPGFNLTAKDLLDSPSGEWIFGLGSFNTVVFPLVNDSRLARFN